MSAPIFEAVGAPAAHGGSNTSVTVALPTGITAGELLLLFLVSGNGPDSTFGAPSEWVAAPSSGIGTGASNSATNSVKLTVLWKIAGASETTFTVGSSAHGNFLAARIARVSGTDTVNPFNTSGNTSGSATTTAVLPGCTTTTSDCLVLHLTATDRDFNSTNFFTGWTSSSLDSITEQFDGVSNTGGGGGLGAASGVKATAGAVTAGTVTQGSSEEYASITIAIQEPQVTVNNAKRFILIT